ncbi:hypothetical protein [Kordiimonas aestuarii]|uniref:hypothetical protein n=1 Tax=Kordiimonas aestuarii TaxID=1005925 RepID=UPI0021CFB2B5|nr:hypothetical protein [Kordiimonas aestuarii]
MGYTFLSKAKIYSAGHRGRTIGQQAYSRAPPGAQVIFTQQTVAAQRFAPHLVWNIAKSITQTAGKNQLAATCPSPKPGFRDRDSAKMKAAPSCAMMVKTDEDDEERQDTA